MFVDQIGLGDHAAFFYHTKSEQLSVVIPFIAIGLQRNERCLYIAEDNTTAEISRHLQEFGVDALKAQKEGALTIATKHETYLRHGVFQPDKMILDICHAVQGAVDDGYAGLRASGELSWALDLPSALAQMIQYEEALEEHFYSKFAALCQYDESRYPAYIFEHMKRLHPVVVSGGELIRKPSKRKDHATAAA
jgi:MEDS: MEthanogen/methylotroph, DcmR Sensory domain